MYCDSYESLGQACTWQLLCFAEDYFRGQSRREQLKTEAVCIHTDVYSWANISLPDLRKTRWNTALAAESVRLFELITVACSVMWFAWKHICFFWKYKMTSVVVCIEKPRLRWQAVSVHKWLQMFGWGCKTWGFSSMYIWGRKLGTHINMNITVIYCNLSAGPILDWLLLKMCKSGNYDSCNASGLVSVFYFWPYRLSSLCLMPVTY